MKKILAPHKEQDGWKYIRVKFTGEAWCDGQPLEVLFRDAWDAVLQRDPINVAYNDGVDGSRIISSRRVERAVEIDDFLRLCAEEGLHVAWHPDDGPELTHYTKKWERGWCVFMVGQSDTSYAPTLREAYYRYHAAVGE